MLVVRLEQRGRALGLERMPAEHQGDTTTLIDTWRQSRAEIANVLAADRGEVTTDADPAWSAPERDEA